MTTTQPINPILSMLVTTISMYELLSDIDLDNYEMSTTKYRKPSYQRGLTRDYNWGIKLVESVLERKSIGAIHLSRWSESQQVDGIEEVDEYFNIEDGQTRAASLLAFKNGKFTTKYGTYQDERIKNQFNTYQIPVVQFSKSKPNIRDAIFFATLCENFSLLQEGSALTASDRYWSSDSVPDKNYSGSPLVNYTQELVNGQFRQQFAEYMGTSGLSARNKKTRGDLANIIGIVSSAWKGASYANGKYFVHVPLLEMVITAEDKRNIVSRLKKIFDVIQSAYREEQKHRGERVAPLFKTSNKFTAAMLADFASSTTFNSSTTPTGLAESTAMRTRTRTDAMKADCWKKLINQYRREKTEDVKDPLEATVYSNLTAGQKRNVMETDIMKRLGAAHQWYDRTHTVT
jgi:hypothetical protein